MTTLRPALPPTQTQTRTQIQAQTSGMPPAGATLQRDDSLDIAKGFGIILVVLGHCMDGLVFSAFFPASRSWPSVLIDVIYSFHMPLFFLVSGHLASGKHRSPRETVARLLPTIVWPYFLWSILQGLVQVYMSRFTSSHVPISALYKILWIPIIPFWFLYALFFCHLGYLAIRKLPYWVQMAIAGIVFVVPAFFIRPLTQASLQIVLETVRGFLYFILGVVSVSQVKRLGWRSALAASILFALWLAGFHALGLGGTAGTILIVPAAVAGIAATLGWSRLLAGLRVKVVGTAIAWLAFLGRYSMSIYVMHIFFTAGVRILLKRLGTHDTVAGTWLEIGSATVLGVLVPLGINWGISRCKADRWFGLQHIRTA